MVGTRQVAAETEAAFLRVVETAAAYQASWAAVAAEVDSGGDMVVEEDGRVGVDAYHGAWVLQVDDPVAVVRSSHLGAYRAVSQWNCEMIGQE